MVVKHTSFLFHVTDAWTSALTTLMPATCPQLNSQLHSLLTSANHPSPEWWFFVDFSLHLLSSLRCYLLTPVLLLPHPASNSCFLLPITLEWQQEMVLFHFVPLFPGFAHWSFVSSRNSMQYLWSLKLVCSFPRARITNYHKLGGLKNRNWWTHSSGGQRPYSLL